eukprot:SAG22_NODE_2762_length_2234_cov_1.135363_2_plen_240_part_00
MSMRARSAMGAGGSGPGTDTEVSSDERISSAHKCVLRGVHATLAALGTVVLVLVAKARDGETFGVAMTSLLAVVGAVVVAVSALGIIITIDRCHCLLAAYFVTMFVLTAGIGWTFVYAVANFVSAHCCYPWPARTRFGSSHLVAKEALAREICLLTLLANHLKCMCACTSRAWRRPSRGCWSWTGPQSRWCAGCGAAQPALRPFSVAQHRPAKYAHAQVVDSHPIVFLWLPIRRTSVPT